MPITRMKSSPAVRVRQTLVGVAKIARQLDVTPGHLSRVIRGERQSPRIEKFLRRLHIEIPQATAAKCPQTIQPKETP